MGVMKLEETMKKKTLIFFDTETTGVRKSDVVIQATFIIVRNGIAIKTIDRYIYTTKQIPRETSAIHGVTNEILKEKAHKINGEYADLEDVMNEVYNYIPEGDGILWIAHNAKFDKRLIEQTLAYDNSDMFVDFGSDITSLDLFAEGVNKTFCTMKAFSKIVNEYKKNAKNVDVAKYVIKSKGNYDLSVLNPKFELFCKSTGADFSGSTLHNSLYDTFLTFFSFTQLADFKGIWK